MATDNTSSNEDDTAAAAAGTMPRDVLVDALTGAYPTWTVVGAERAIDRPHQPTVVIKQRTITPHPTAPISHYQVACTVTIIDEHTDPTLAEPALDGNVLNLWETLMSMTSVHPSEATKVMWGNEHMAYDITTTLTVKKG